MLGTRYTTSSALVTFLFISVFINSSSNTFAQTLTDKNFTAYYQDPASHIGQYAILTGKVFNVIPSSGGYEGFQIYLSGDTNKDIAVFYNASQVRNDSTENDCVKIVGTTTDMIEYTNALGGKLSAPGILAISLKRISCLDMVDPEAKTVTVGQIQNKGGIKVTFHKVELTKKEARVFLTVDNTNKNHDVHFYSSSDSLALIGNKQFETKFSNTYPQIRSNIPPGIQENGVVVFEPLDEKVAQFQIKMSKGFSENYEFIFIVPVFLPQSSKYVDSKLGLSLDYPSGWAEEPSTNSNSTSICAFVTGSCFNVAYGESTNTDSDLVSQVVFDTFLNETSTHLIKPLQMANYTIDGERVHVFTISFIMANTNVVGQQQNIVVIHDGKVYVFQFAAHPASLTDPEMKKIVEHMIKSIKWTR